MNSSYFQVAKVAFDIEDLLDWRIRARTLRDEIIERAWDRLPPSVDGDLEAEISLDGQMIDVAFIGAKY